MAVDLHYCSLADTAAAIASGALSSLEVTTHAADRIAALEPRLHAFAEVRTDAALAEARAADEARACSGECDRALHGGRWRQGPLRDGRHGRPGPAASSRPGSKEDDTATGRQPVAGRWPASSSARLQPDRRRPGTRTIPSIASPVNPWAPGHWSGSSSSGSGVSVAAGLAYGAIGTDTAGSIRMPSACNHLAGLKPTWGRISRHGVFPLSDTFDHVGPMARSVLDLALMFAAMAGADPLDVTSLDAPPSDWVGAARTGSPACGSASMPATPSPVWTRPPSGRSGRRWRSCRAARGLSR